MDAADGQVAGGGGFLPRTVATRAQTRSHPSVQHMDDTMAALRCGELAALLAADAATVKDAADVDTDEAIDKVVLGSLELGWLHGPLVEAGIRSLASLRSESTSRLVTKLTGVGKQCNAAVCQKLVTHGLLTSTSDAPEPLVLMRD